MSIQSYSDTVINLDDPTWTVNLKHFLLRYHAILLVENIYVFTILATMFSK